MTNTNSTNNPDKNKMFIGIFTLIIVIIAVIVFAVNHRSTEDNSGAGSSATTVASVSVVSEDGAQDSVIDASFDIRNVKFGQKIKAVKKYEAKQKDTLDDPYVSKSDDGYTYLTYTYNPDNVPTFFGTAIPADDSTSMLVYVFYNKRLIELRIQYGKVGTDAFNNIVSTINSTYGNSTYFRALSNGSQEYWWKTDETTLDVLCQDSDVIAYYRANSH